MTTIVQTVPNATTLVKAATLTTLNGTADNFTYFRNTGQVLLLNNPTGGTISNVKLMGSTAGIAGVPGGEPKDYSVGFSVGSLAAGTWKIIQLDSIYNYLSGVCSVSGGSTLTAILVDGG